MADTPSQCTMQTSVTGTSFCARGSEYDNGEWWEFDCDVREVTDDDTG